MFLYIVYEWEQFERILGVVICQEKTQLTIASTRKPSLTASGS